MEKKDRHYYPVEPLKKTLNQIEESDAIGLDPRTGLIGTGKAYGEYTSNNRPVGAVSLEQTSEADIGIDESTGYIVFGKSYGEQSFNNRPRRVISVPRSSENDSS